MQQQLYNSEKNISLLYKVYQWKSFPKIAKYENVFFQQSGEKTLTAKKLENK